MSRVVVFCRLEGSPFDPYLRPAGPSADALRTLDQQGIVVVFFSSRTRAELELVQEQLGVRHPFVSENGGAVFIRRGYWSPVDLDNALEIAGFQALVYGLAYVDVVAALRRVAQRTGVRIVGFSDMSVSEVAAEFRLSSLQAQLAKLRDYEEPFRIQDEDVASAPRLWRALAAEGFHCRMTGRFTYAGQNADPGDMVSELLRLYRMRGPIVSIGIGDPRHDRSLLRRTDRVLTLQITDGPAAWTQAILDATRIGSILAPRSST